jgi:hypothetical protein
VSRNVDIVAVTLLLVGIAVYAHVRNVISFEINSHRFEFTHSRMIVLPPRVPPPPPLPHIKVMRD